MFFPSLHSPSCFGAQPDTLECFKYLCDYGGLPCRDITKESSKMLSLTTKKNNKYRMNSLSALKDAVHESVIGHKVVHERGMSIVWEDPKKRSTIRVTIEVLPFKS